MELDLMSNHTDKINPNIPERETMREKYSFVVFNLISHPMIKSPPFFWKIIAWYVKKIKLIQ
jgi:hypothetical protein